MDRSEGAAPGKEQLSSRRRIGSLPELRNVKTMPSLSPIPLTSITGHGLAYTSDTTSKHTTTAVIFVFVRTRQGSDIKATQPQAAAGCPILARSLRKGSESTAASTLGLCRRPTT